MNNGADIWVKEGFRLFAKKGVEGIRVAPLSRAIGVAKSSFYHFFESPEGYFEELLDFWVNEYTKMAYELSQSNSHPKQKFYSFMSLGLINNTPIEFYNQLKGLNKKDKLVHQKMKEVRQIKERFLALLFIEAGYEEKLIIEKREIIFSLSFGWELRSIEKNRSEMEAAKSLGNMWDSIDEFLQFSSQKR